MEINKSLEYLGLNEKQAKVYLALLQMGSSSVPLISVKAGTKRPTTYLLLEELRMKGLATLLPRKKKVIYTAESPQKLMDAQRERQEIINEILPELLAIYNSREEKPKITFYQGNESIIKLYDEIFKEKEILFYGSIASISPVIYEQIVKHLEKIKKEKINVREVLQADQKSIEFAKNNISENHQIKIATKNYSFPTDNMIFGNKVAIIAYKDTPMAVVIESSDVVATYKSMFEIVWQAIDQLGVTK